MGAEKNPTATAAISPPERLLPAALALLSRVLDTLQAAQRGQLPSLRPLEDGNFPLPSTGQIILRLENCHVEIIIGLTAMHTWHHLAAEQLCGSKVNSCFIERRPAHCGCTCSLASMCWVSFRDTACGGYSRRRLGRVECSVKCSCSGLPCSLASLRD